MKSDLGRLALIIFLNEDHPDFPVKVVSKQYIRPLGIFFG